MVAEGGDLALQRQPMLRIQGQHPGAADGVAGTRPVLADGVDARLVRRKHQPGGVVQAQRLPGLRIQPAVAGVEAIGI